jgi:hypothetical protein
MLVPKLLVFNVKDVWEEMRSFCCFISVLKNVAMPQVEQELLAIPEHMSLPRSFVSHR